MPEIDSTPSPGSWPFHKFSLGDPTGDDKLPYVNASGAFLGPGVALLERDELGLWRPRPQSILERLFETGYGVPVDLGSRMGSLEAVASALNKDDLCLASIGLVQTRLPELPDPVLAKRMAETDALLKFNVQEPRIPKHHPGGGEWTTGDPYTPASWIWPWEKYKVVHNPPADAVEARRNDGSKIPDPASPTGFMLAPQKADFTALYEQGLTMRGADALSQILALIQNFSHAGTYDFQRDTDAMVFYKQYVHASNYGIGVYANAAAIPKQKMLNDLSAYAYFFSSNAASHEGADWASRGWDDAQNGYWKRRR